MTDRADVGPANDGNVSIADVHSVNVDEWLASFGRSSDRRVGVHGLPAATGVGARKQVFVAALAIVTAEGA